MKKINILLGADNVGKTTLINNSMKFCNDQLKLKPFYYHFSAPNKGRHPKDMYKSALYTNIRDAILDETDILYIDRAWPESKFYELNRRGINITWESCFEVEQAYKNFADVYGYQIHIYVMVKEWDFIEKFHIQELNKSKEFVLESNAKNQEPMELGARKLEHQKYYRFMMDYKATREIMIPDIARVMTWNLISTENIEFVLI